MKTPVPYKPKGSKYYLFRFKNDNGAYSLRSTGQVKKYAAIEYIEKYMIEIGKLKGAVKFKDFVEKIFVWGECPIIADKIEHKKRFSKSHAIAKRAILVKNITPYFGEKYLHEIKHIDIKEFLAKLELSEQSKNHHLFTLRQIFRYAVDKELIPASPAESRALVYSVEKKGKAIFTDKELNKLFPDKPLTIWEEQKYLVMFAILSNCGLRSGELRALTWRDFKPKKKALYIRHSYKEMERAIGDTKTGNERAVPLNLFSDRPMLWINQYKTDCNNPSGGLMFPNENGKPLAGNVLALRLKKACQLAEIKQGARTPHSFRHGLNTILLKKNCPQEIIRLIMGHSTIKMTKQYDQETLDDLIKRIDDSRKLIENNHKK